MSEAASEAHEQSDENAPDEVEVDASEEEEFLPESGSDEPEEPSTKGVLPALAKECSDLMERQQNGEDVSVWVELDPPTERQEQNSPSIIGNWNGKPIKTGFMIRDLTDSDRADHPDIIMHRVYRTAKYNVHFRVREMEYYGDAEMSPAGSTDENGEIELTVPEQSPAAGELNVIAHKEYADESTEEGYYSSNDQLQGDSELTLEVDGTIAEGETVTVKVLDADGTKVPGAAVQMYGPTKLATGEVFVREQDK